MQTITNTHEDRTINALTIELTAFPSWDAFRTAMENGYVPTLRPFPGATLRNLKTEKLASLLEERNFSVFRGTNRK